VVGMLDKDSEGLLLWNNHFQLSHQSISPKKEIKITYFAEIKGRVTEQDIDAFKKGVILDDGYKAMPAELMILKRGAFSEVEVTITEGKFHQVKRMFEANEKKVVYLKRKKMGEIHLDPILALGEYRELTEEEVNYCLSLIPDEIR